MTRMNFRTSVGISRPRSRMVTAGFGVLVIAGLLTACSAEGKPATPSSPKKTHSLSVVDAFKQSIADRPAVGSAEYEKNVTEKLRVPFVAGQDPAEVVKELETRVETYDELGYADIPHGNKLTALQLKSHKSVEDIVNDANLSYYDTGLQDGLFGGASNAYGQTVIKNFAPVRQNGIEQMLVGNIVPNGKIVTFDAGIQYQKQDIEIMGESKTTYDDNSGQTSDLHYDLKATDTNGDGTPDAWIWTGPNI